MFKCIVFKPAGRQRAKIVENDVKMYGTQANAVSNSNVVDGFYCLAAKIVIAYTNDDNKIADATLGIILTLD